MKTTLNDFAVNDLLITSNGSNDYGLFHIVKSQKIWVSYLIHFWTEESDNSSIEPITATNEAIIEDDNDVKTYWS